MAYPGESQNIAYQDYVLDHAMGDAPGGKAGKRMTKKEWIEYTKKGANKTATAKQPPKTPPGGGSMRNPMGNVYAK